MRLLITPSNASQAWLVSFQLVICLPFPCFAGYQTPAAAFLKTQNWPLSRLSHAAGAVASGLTWLPKLGRRAHLLELRSGRRASLLHQASRALAASLDLAANVKNENLRAFNA